MSTREIKQTKPKGLWDEGMWPTELAVSDSDVATMANNEMIEAFNVIQHTKDHWYVTIELKGGFGGKQRHLTTFRTKTEPRQFKNLTRLVDHIKKKYRSVRKVNLYIQRRAEARLDDEGRQFGVPHDVILHGQTPAPDFVAALQASASKLSSKPPEWPVKTRSRSAVTSNKAQHGV